MNKSETKILMDMNKSIGELSGKVDGINARLDKLNGSIINHDRRININESKLDNLLGKVSIIGSVGVFLGGLIVAAFKYFTRP